MIAWLSEWLKEIVVIVLLAVFVDLVLPNNAMQRYVKIVLSLLILLAILSPLVALLQSGERWDAWLQASSDTESGKSLSGTGEMPALHAISIEAEQMIEARNRQAQELAQLRLEGAIVRSLEESLAIRKAEVSAALRIGASPEEVLLEELGVRLWPHAEAVAAEDLQQSGQPAAFQPIEPIAPVTVSIREDRREGFNTDSVRQGDVQSGHGAADDATDLQSDDMESLQQGALIIIEQQFDIPSDKVRISVEARR